MAEIRYSGARAAQIMKKIADEAGKRPIDYLAVMALTGLSASRARGYLQRMATCKQVHLCESIGRQRLYSTSPRPSDNELDDFANDALRRSGNPHVHPNWCPHPDPVATAWMQPRAFSASQN
jgi:hypothetical protein